MHKSVLRALNNLQIGSQKTDGITKHIYWRTHYLTCLCINVQRIITCCSIISENTAVFGKVCLHYCTNQFKEFFYSTFAKRFTENIWHNKNTYM